MPIETLPRQLRQLGRIRTGQLVAGKRGPRPAGLHTFRLTSPDQELILHAAAAYGGVPRAWREGWEVVTERRELAILIPPDGAGFSQWFELWTASGCVRRCDGIRETLSAGPCLCPADADERRAAAGADPPAACRPVTRLSIILPELPDLGVWMLETRSYYAAVELAGAADVLATARERGQLLPASLILTERTRRAVGEVVKRYTVPAIRFAGTISAGLEPGAVTPQLAAGASGPVAPHPAALPSESAGPLALSREAFLDACTREGFPIAWAVQRAEEVYPARRDLRPVELGALLELLRAEAGA